MKLVSIFPAAGLLISAFTGAATAAADEQASVNATPQFYCASAVGFAGNDEQGKSNGGRIVYGPSTSDLNVKVAADGYALIPHGFEGKVTLSYRVTKSKEIENSLSLQIDSMDGVATNSVSGSFGGDLYFEAANQVAMGPVSGVNKCEIYAFEIACSLNAEKAKNILKKRFEGIEIGPASELPKGCTTAFKVMRELKRNQ